MFLLLHRLHVFWPSVEVFQSFVLLCPPAPCLGVLRQLWPRSYKVLKCSQVPKAVPPTRGVGNRGSLPQAPSVRGPPNSAETCSGFRSQSMTNGNNETSPMSFKSACLSYVRTVQSLARAPFVVLFGLKPLNEDGNLQVYVCTVCRHKKEPQKPPEHASEHVTPQTPLAQSILWAPLFVFALGPSHPLGGPGLRHTALCMKFVLCTTLNIFYDWKPCPH